MMVRFEAPGLDKTLREGRQAEHGGVLIAESLEELREAGVLDDVREAAAQATARPAPSAVREGAAGAGGMREPGRSLGWGWGYATAGRAMVPGARGCTGAGGRVVRREPSGRYTTWTWSCTSMTGTWWTSFRRWPMPS